MLAARAPVPVEIAEIPDERLPEPVEAPAYYLIAEALTNVTKYAHASTARARVAAADGNIVVEVSDDGVADPRSGCAGSDLSRQGFLPGSRCGAGNGRTIAWTAHDDEFSSRDGH